MAEAAQFLPSEVKLLPPCLKTFNAISSRDVVHDVFLACLAPFPFGGMKRSRGPTGPTTAKRDGEPRWMATESKRSTRTRVRKRATTRGRANSTSAEPKKKTLLVLYASREFSDENEESSRFSRQPRRL